MHRRAWVGLALVSPFGGKGLSASRAEPFPYIEGVPPQFSLGEPAPQPAAEPSK